MAHGPKGIKRELVLPQAMRRKAMHIALTMKANEGEVVVASNLSTITKTNQAQKLVKAISKKKGQKFTFVLAEYKEEVVRALRNLANAEIMTLGNLNAYSVAFGGIIILDDQITEVKAEKKVVKKTVKKTNK